MLGSLFNLQHTVEAGIAHHGSIGDTNLGQEFLADLVLHKEMSEAIKHATILAAIPLKEHLLGTEDARHAIDRYTTMLQDVQVVVPELVFDKESHHRSDRAQESASVSYCVEWQIGDDVGSLVVLAHLIT